MSFRSTALRAAVLGATAFLTTAGAAQAAATRLVDGSLIDATSDGRYVLYDDGSGPRLLDRAAGTTLPVPAGAEQLADHSPRILIHGADGYRVFDTTTGTLTLATLDGNANVVAATKPALVRDGRSVIFQTGSGNTARILERKLDTATTTERLAGVSLLHASEDGHVITWSRPLPPVFRPAGQIPLPADPADGVPGTAVGYRVDDAAPRVVRTTLWSQQGTGNFAARCTAWTYGTSISEPLDLRVVQDGSTARYAFALTTHNTNAYQPSEVITTTLINAAGEQQALGAVVAQETADFAFDPVSSAYSFGVRFRDQDGTLGRAHGYLFPDDASRLDLGITLDQYGNDAGSTNVGTVVPVLRGASAIADAAQGTGPRSVYSFPGAPAPVGPNPNGWISLPRAADAVDGASIKPEARYSVCAPVAPVSDYVKVTPLPGTSRAQSVQFIPTIDGKVGVSRLTARVTWFGVTVWTRYFIGNPGTFTTPALPVGLAGFKLSFTLQMQDGPAISASQTLR